MIGRSLRMAIVPLLVASVPAGAAVPPPDPNDIVARTKTTTGPYALYLWNRLTLTGEAPLEEWSAEFRSGDLHRVETPRDRIVANCRTGTGFAYSVETGQTDDGAWIARAACGINTNVPFQAIEWQGRVQTKFGPADRIRIVAGDLIRRYDVSPEGVLLRTVFWENGPGEAQQLVGWAVGVEKALPDDDMFSRASLKRSAVPARYKRAPQAPR